MAITKTVMGSEEEAEKRPRLKKRKYMIEDVVMKKKNKIEPLLGESHVLFIASHSVLFYFNTSLKLAFHTLPIC